MFSLVFSTLFRYIKPRVNTDKINGEISPTIPRLKLTLLLMQVCCYIKVISLIKIFILASAKNRV